MRQRHMLADVQPRDGQLVYYTADGHHGVARYVRGTLIDNTTFDVVAEKESVLWWATAFDVEQAAGIDTRT
ncbi:hypothetical protein ACQQ2N_04645 [Dokdonella sp. MW10]|uniref:hypothetical protein n=1 Tax=Dokdonella sp. MW10 TaxID=2992926 RepID=UPI003F7F879F